MKNWSRRKKIIVALLVVFLAAQAIQPKMNQGPASGPADIAHIVQTPDSILTMLRVSCYDCHSDSTNYPWYDRIAPISWWIGNHVKEGKRELNFSRFGEYTTRRQTKKLKETAELIEKEEMPLSSYTFIHNDAKLNEAERKLLVDWAKASQTLIETKRQP